MLLMALSASWPAICPCKTHKSGPYSKHTLLKAVGEKLPDTVLSHQLLELGTNELRSMIGRKLKRAEGFARKLIVDEMLSTL